jgi:hypothetical protein
MSALRRRAVEGGSYRVVVSLTRVTLWLLSLGIFDKKYAHATAGSSDEQTYVAPDLFTADTPLGLYQGVTEQVVMSRTPGSFRTVLAVLQKQNGSRKNRKNRKKIRNSMIKYESYWITFARKYAEEEALKNTSNFITSVIKTPNTKSRMSFRWTCPLSDLDHPSKCACSNRNMEKGIPYRILRQQ